MKYLLLLLFIFFTSCTTFINPSKPDLLPNEEIIINNNISSINIPIKIPKKAITFIAENKVPKEIKGQGGGIYKIQFDLLGKKLGQTIHIKPLYKDWHYNWNYLLNINNFKIDFNNNKISLSAEIKGILSASWDIIKGSATTDINATIKFDFLINLLENLKLNVKVKSYYEIHNAEIPVDIKIGKKNFGMKVDVAKYLPDNLKSLTDKISEGIESKIKEISLKEPLENFAKEIQKPININKQTNSWLLISPEELNISNLKTDEINIILNIGLKANTNIFLNKKPENFNLLIPKIALNNEKEGKFIINLPTEIYFKELNEIIKKEITKKAIKAKGQKVKIKDIEIFGNGKYINVKVDFLSNGTFDTKGVLYFKGLLKWDSIKKVVYVDEFDFDINTKNILIKSADWLLHEDFTQTIQSKLVWNFENKFLKAKEDINSKINKIKLNESAELNINLNEFSIENIYSNNDKIIINVKFSGIAEAVIYNLMKGVLNE